MPPELIDRQQLARRRARALADALGLKLDIGREAEQSGARDRG